MNNPALLLVDLQEDFLNRAGLLPPRHQLTARVGELLRGCRTRGVPVFHVHTRVAPDGSNRMPHWQRADTWACVEGTPGVKPPAELQPLETEGVFAKPFYSAFGAADLEARLSELGVKTVVVAGVYLHACVRATALDAYERGYEVWIAGDAVGSSEPVHGEITRSYLAERASRFADVDEILIRLGAKTRRPDTSVLAVPAACIGGVWREADDERRLWHLQPADLRRTLAAVPLVGRGLVGAAAEVVAAAQPAWSRRQPQERSALLQAWAVRLSRDATQLSDLMVEEIGKPRRDADAEVERAVAHVETALRLLSASTTQKLGSSAAVEVRHRPVGNVGLVTPWNNPVAIPVGKIAPALAFGNGVVWKPAPQAPCTAIALMTGLLEVGVPPELVSLVFGDGDTARHLCSEPSIAAISVTGSMAAGATASALCGQYGKRLQAELGGNNPSIVLADCDLEETAAQLALSAFGFAGQRCTATRRILIERQVLEPLTEALVSAVRRLGVGDPALPETVVGPLIAPAQRERVAAAVARAVAEGGRVLCGGGEPPQPEFGCYFEPTLVSGLDPDASLVREETFGPVAVILPVDDLDDAMRLANQTEYGLVASLCTRDEGARRCFAEAIEAGMLNFASSALAVHAEAPFGGWKASGVGPPEHGVWDREFYTRPQALYGRRHSETGS